ncbi:MAG: hypothetical protein AB1503_02095 [Bacillota bacterium]|nr:hypothetical protein [Bacillota bacterium]
MDWYLVAVGSTGLLVLLSIAHRVRLIRMARQQEEAVPPVSSPVAEAVKQLVGVAGGVYVALVSLAAFLRLPAQQTVELFGITFDPVALAALIIAILQPFFVPGVSPRP